jgi:6-phosphogluconolactonase (cycloisomerase 2 family)
MFMLTRVTALTGMILAAGGLTALPASAAEGHPTGGGVVFVQNDAVGGNQVIAYDRDRDGSLREAGTYATGGRGGRLQGAVVDFTASQGALAADRAHGELYVVNAGSDTISAFGVHGDRLRLRQVLPSGGSFPVSITVHGDLVYVLNARGGGSIQGYRHVGGRLLPVPAWHRDLRLPVAGAEFTHTPGQVAFTPDGRHLVVTTKAATDSLLVFNVGRGGRLAHRPVVRAEYSGTVPFAVDFDAAGHLAVAEAGPNAVATYRVARDGTLVPLASTALGQQATCWIDAFGNLLAVSNAGSATETTLRSDGTGHTTKITDTPTDPGTVDADFTPDGRYLYVQTGATGHVDAFGVGHDGSLSRIGSVAVPNAVGAEGIVAW